jgi:hypothetical protein
LGNGLAYLAHKALHIKILEYETNDGMCEQVRCSQGKHDTGCNIDKRPVEVRRKLDKEK